jgi:hypothetical protein
MDNCPEKNWRRHCERFVRSNPSHAWDCFVAQDAPRNDFLASVAPRPAWETERSLVVAGAQRSRKMRPFERTEMLLNEMLRLLSEGGIHSIAEMARRLGVGQELAAAMVADLARRGYLAPLDMGCATRCDGCGLASACAAPGSPTMPLLALSAKGRRATGKT